MDKITIYEKLLAYVNSMEEDEKKMVTMLKQKPRIARSALAT